jgi:acyl-CoA synthetase (AMP-forming)/AMP-acid ligase II
MLSHRNILDHVLTYAGALDATPGDCVVSWLPLYHDMGLIAAFHLPLTLGITSVQIDPFEWVAAPSLLLEAIASEKGTLAWLPNFAYNILATRVHDDELEGVDLSSMRMFINCSEPVRSDSHQRFYERFQSFGVRMENLAACYAMAEATFAVTQTAPRQPARTLALSATDLSRGRVVPQSDLSLHESACRQEIQFLAR